MLKNIFFLVVDHDGSDPLKYKHDRMVYFVFVLFIGLVVLPLLWFIWRLLFACCHIKQVVELDEKQWKEYSRKKTQ